MCPTPGCPELTPGGRCGGCQAKAAQDRPTARQKGYNRRWERTRTAYLHEHPYCECDQCAALPVLLRPLAEHVHHKDGLGPLGPRGHDWDNLQALTHSHHSRETAHDQPGGWHADHY
ncbi:HNH endonuclease signature motif containing protein [Streptomonospora wellingtoniae]|uniref:HNH endonuclease signature motif containing protein n=1 Tax=Streptomonospora wellingtoniae TaxID=3075544 RepID=A0ABU2L120_9ACTN|nr:HNH endonuclease signature motif containing protein [Streptomonospora sp. DSM 45055]MDT0305077.1 HNH endonuclease signature motif containing protein [Streptomonospora sp. DSM 45055]